MASIKERIDNQISRGLIAKARVSIKELILQEDKDKFYTDMRGVYDGLYPQYRPFKDEDEQQDYWKAYRDSEDALADKDGIPKEQVGIQEFDKWVKLAPQVVVIDYSEDENYLSFEDFKNETKVITEAVYYTLEELTEMGWIDDIQIKVKTPEVIEPLRPYIATEPTPLMINDKVRELGFTYKEARERDYPSLTELADAIVKGGDALDEYKAKCLAVKTRYPKPDEN